MSDKRHENFLKCCDEVESLLKVWDTAEMQGDLTTSEHCHKEVVKRMIKIQQYKILLNIEQGTRSDKSN